MTDERDGQTEPGAAAAADRPATSEEPTKVNKSENPERSDKNAPREETPDEDGSTDEDEAADGDGSTDEDDDAGESAKTNATAEARAGGQASRSGARASGPRRSRSKLATTVSVGGELLITAGVVLGLFVAYSLWWTNVIADREAAKESDKVREHWAADRDLSDDDSKGPGQLDTKDGIGFLHAPALGKKEILIKPGTNPKDLNQGIAGYYKKPVKSAMPWDEKGNFSLAAHRDGHGAKFHNIHKLADGDPLVFETKDTWYVYKVYAKLPETSKYNVEVLDSVPKESGKKEEGRYITLTTCTPVYTSNYRYVVWGELERTEVVDADRTPPKEIVDN